MRLPPLQISVLGLVRDDGYLISCYPQPDAASLDELYGKPVGDAMMAYLHTNKFPQQGQVQIPDGDGKTKDFRELRCLRHYPVTLFADVPMTEINAAWWDRMRDTYFLLALMLAGIVVFYSMSFRRRYAWSTAQRRGELRHKYEQVLNERSPNEIFMFDTETLQISYANEYALNNTGYKLA